MDNSDKRSIIIVAFHFPPIQGSSGYHRVLSFAKHFPALGWQPRILTVRDLAYVKSNPDNLALVPGDVEVVRSLALDAARHLAIKGRYPGWLAVPDRWRSWVPFAVRAAKRMIRRQRPDVILSTFPIASAHLVARTIHRKTGIPWVADFRDPMVLDNHPPEGKIRCTYADIEASVFREAAAVIVTTPGADEMYRRRYPSAAEKITVVQNGFDEEIFDVADGMKDRSKNSTKIKLLHSGLVYREARDPRPLFRAIAKLVNSGEILESKIEIMFRASSQERFIVEEAKRHGLERIVTVGASISYKEAISEMLASDSLLLLQSRDCNIQIPAKAYEYLRCGRPILAITDPYGDTGKLLSTFGVTDIAALENDSMIAAVVRRHFRNLAFHDNSVAEPERVASLARRARAAEAIAILDEIVT